MPWFVFGFILKETNDWDSGFMKTSHQKQRKSSSVAMNGTSLWSLFLFCFFVFIFVPEKPQPP